MRHYTIIVTACAALLVAAGTAPAAATLELDCYEEAGHDPGVLAVVDNREGTESVMVESFAPIKSGTIQNTYWYNNEPDYPWDGIYEHEGWQVIGDLWYGIGYVSYFRTEPQYWQPGVTTYDPETGEMSELPWGEVPAGVLWAVPLGIEGDVTLFQSPAAGDFTVDGETTRLYDDDPAATLPEPTTAVLMLAGAFLWRRRRPTTG